MADTQTILYWPDGSWMLAEDYCETEFRYKGDDIQRLNVPADWDLDQIERECGACWMKRKKAEHEAEAALRNMDANMNEQITAAIARATGQEG